MVRDTILYDRLGVQANATDEQIKKAYRKLAVTCHPDKKQEHEKEEANKKFHEISEAYEILSDSNKRKQYDSFGYEAINGNTNEGSNIPPDIFNMFNGFSPFGGFTRPQQHEEKEVLMHRVTVTLEELFNGCNKEIHYKIKDFCSSCEGTGAKNKKLVSCTACHGTGQVTMIRQMGNMIQQMVQPCNQCVKGKVIGPNNNCENCSGSGFNWVNKKLTVPIKAGCSHGQKIRVEGKGHIMKEGKTDLILILEEQEHSFFQRKGLDLFCKINIRLYEAICGFTRVISHINGKKIIISSDSFINNGDAKIIRNEGMIDLQGRRGNLMIFYEVSLPKTKLANPSEVVKHFMLDEVDKISYEKEESLKKLVESNPNDYQNVVINNFNPETYQNHREHHQPNFEDGGERAGQCTQQ
jgi:DnaJ-class molecular chaperone